MGGIRLSAIRVFDFKQALTISTGTSANRVIGDILLENIPGSTRAIQANQHNDRHGVDWWLEMQSGDFLGVDCKIREEDPKPKFGKDDLALETWSVVEKKVVGWTLDDAKRTDYVFWFWKDTGRWCVVPFLLLRRAFQIHLVDWKAAFRVATQCTDRRYHSECVFVPRREVWAAIYKLSEGLSEQLQQTHGDQGVLFARDGGYFPDTN